MAYNKYSTTYRMKYGHKNIITSQKYVSSCGAVWSDHWWRADIGAGSGLMSMAVVGPVLAAGGRCCVAVGVMVVSVVTGAWMVVVAAATEGLVGDVMW